MYKKLANLMLFAQCLRQRQILEMTLIYYRAARRVVDYRKAPQGFDENLIETR